VAAACRPYPGRSGLPSSVYTAVGPSQRRRTGHWPVSTGTVAVPMYQCRPGLLSTQVVVVQDKATAMLSDGRGSSFDDGIGTTETVTARDPLKGKPVRTHQ
jgi:hypothetical protein